MKLEKEKILSLYMLCLLPAAGFAVFWSMVGFRWQNVDLPFLAYAAVTVVFASSFQIKLPRSNVHLTASDALLVFGLLVYGIEAAILLSVIESAVNSLQLRRSGVWMKPRTMLFNVQLSAIAMLFSGLAFEIVSERLVAFDSLAGFLLTLTAVSISMFAVNCVVIAPILSLKNDRSIFANLREYASESTLIHVIGVFTGGLIFKTLLHIDLTTLIAALGVFSLVYWSYRRNISEVRRASSDQREAARRRAEQAESHVSELEQYIGELEKTGIELRESRERFKHAAYHDDLTGLPNRSYFIKKITDLLGENSRSEGPRFAVLFLDLNRFKTLNDSLGHSMGDLLITHVGARLTSSLRRGCTVGRFGGDEFAILFESVDSRESIAGVAAEIARQLAEPFSLSGRQVFSSVSIGIAFDEARYDRAEEVLRDSDIAMYYAKENQKPFEIFDQQMHDKAVSLLDLETDLRTAIRRKQFELFYQPIVDLDNARIVGFEALVRWIHPTRGLIPPNEFIHVAESTGLIIPMTVELLRDACLQIKKWQDVSNDDLMVSVNLSGKHFGYPTLVDQIADILEETGVQPSCLKLEITESAVMNDAEGAIAMLKRIKETGVKISIDDFGTGYSSLSYLHRFPIDTLKIDRSFVNTMEEGTENGEIVRTVIALARALKLDVIAEGIESVHQLHQLRVLGCEFGQGYLFSRPLPVAAIDRMLAEEVPWKGMVRDDESGIVVRNGEFTRLKWAQWT